MIHVCPQGSFCVRPARHHAARVRTAIAPYALVLAAGGLGLLVLIVVRQRRQGMTAVASISILCDGSDRQATPRSVEAVMGMSAPRTVAAAPNRAPSASGV